ICNDRLQQSPALREWWEQQQKGRGPKVQDDLDHVKTFSSYLGDEIAFAVAKKGKNYTAPVVLARARQPGLEACLQHRNSQLTSKSSQTAIQIVHDPMSAAPSTGHPLLVYVNNGLMIATSEASELQVMARRSQASSQNIEPSPFYQHVAQAYEQGVQWLFCADMEQIVTANVQAHSNRHELPPGIGDVRYLTMEYREVSGKPESR